MTERTLTLPSRSKPPWTIAWVSAVGEKGGAEMTMIRTFRYLKPDRFKAAVFLLRPGPLEEELRDVGATVYKFAPHRMRNAVAVWKCARDMARICRRDGIHLIHSNGFRPHVYGSIAARWAGIPEVWTVHSPEIPTLFNKFVLRKQASHLISNCPRTAQYFESVGHPNQMIWPGVDIARLDKGTPREELASKFGIPSGTTWVSMAARLQRYKGQHHFVESIARLAPGPKPVHGIVIGGALFGMELDYLEELKQLASRLGAADRIHFTGFVSDEDVAGLLAASDLVVHPALEEDFGITVAEAQILGKPVVAFSAVGPTYILIDGETGRLVPVGDQEGLNKAVADTLADPERMRQWGAAGSIRSRRDFGIMEHVAKTEEIYERCILRGRGAD